MARSVSAWNMSHPCADQRMGWPDDALRGVPRTTWVSMYDHVACAAGNGPLDRAVRTQRLLLDGLLEASRTQTLPNFPAVRLGLADAHCNETSLAYATFGKNGQPCLARLIPSEHFGPVSKPRSGFFWVASALSWVASESEGARRCGWAGNSQSDATRDPKLPAGLFKPLRKRFVDLALNHTDFFDVFDMSGAFPRLSFRAQVFPCSYF